NSVVKPSSANGTAGETLWESRTPPALCPLREEGAFYLGRRRPELKSSPWEPRRLWTGYARFVQELALGARMSRLRRVVVVERRCAEGDRRGGAAGAAAGRRARVELGWCRRRRRWW